MRKITLVSHFKQMLLYNLKLVKNQLILKSQQNQKKVTNLIKKKKKTKKIMKHQKKRIYHKARNGISFFNKSKKCRILFLKFTLIFYVLFKELERKEIKQNLKCLHLLINNNR